ncbi:MAG: restriction endonuclease [Micropepsaceae bacterium]
MLSGADAMGPNPWTAPRPTAAAHGLTTDDLDDDFLANAIEKTRTELKQFGSRYLSSFIVPLSVFGVAYYVLVGDVSFVQTPIEFTKLPIIDPSRLPAWEWAAYLGASLILAATAAFFQSHRHKKAKVAREHYATAGERFRAFQEAERAWVAEQRRRTTAAFWQNDIRKLAAGKGMKPNDVFAQEVGKLFVAWGWMVKLNQRSHDYGVDIFANGKEGSAVVQCSHSADGGPAASEVRDLAGSRHAFDADYGLMISIHPPGATRQNEFFSERGQLEFWHLGHILEQALVLFKQRTGENPPDDGARSQFLNRDGTPIAWHVGEQAAE